MSCNWATNHTKKIEVVKSCKLKFYVLFCFRTKLKIYCNLAKKTKVIQSCELNSLHYKSATNHTKKIQFIESVLSRATHAPTSLCRNTEWPFRSKILRKCSKYNWIRLKTSLFIEITEPKKMSVYSEE
jgi:hypothetical protein